MERYRPLSSDPDWKQRVHRPDADVLFELISSMLVAVSQREASH